MTKEEVYRRTNLFDEAQWVKYYFNNNSALMEDADNMTKTDLMYMVTDYRQLIGEILNETVEIN